MLCTYQLKPLISLKNNNWLDDDVFKSNAMGLSGQISSQIRMLSHSIYIYREREMRDPITPFYGDTS